MDCMASGCWTATMNRDRWSATLVFGRQPKFRTMGHTPSQRLLSKLLREHDGRRRRVLDVEEEESRREQSERTTSGLEPSRDCRPGTNDGVCNYSSEDPSTRGSHVGSCTAQLVRDSGGSHMTISRLCGRFLFVFSVLFCFPLLSFPHESPLTLMYRPWSG